jgi:tRNA (cytidine/uridine-2'-O-)-methyltransferase
MLHVALWEPEIPPNTGNVARLCAATGTRLHLIGRLGFRTDDRSVKRAGLDYWPHVDWVKHATFDDFLAAVIPARIWAVDNPAPTSYTRVAFADGDVMLFGAESKGLPSGVREAFADRTISIPMKTPAVRSLNLATAVGVVLYEALRQIERW